MSAGLKDVSDYILWFAGNVGALLTNLKLQKLVFYAQAWSLALEKGQLFEEDFQAWALGPVVRPLYDQYQGYGRNALPFPTEKPALNDTALEEHLDEVLEVFLPLHAYVLQRMTHNEDPWKKARGTLPPNQTSTAVITKESMREFYSKLADS